MTRSTRRARLLPMTTSSLTALSVAAALTALGCQPAGPSGPPDAAPSAARSAASHRTAARPTKARGAVLLDDAWIPVAPFVGHDAHMDLYVQCKAARDRAKAAGKPAPSLCYEDARVNKPQRLRIEHAEGRSGGRAMRALRAADGGAHFLIEPNGSIRQVLDLAYPPRRGGVVRRGEIRVLSGSRAGQEALGDALVQAFPGLQVETVEVDDRRGEAPAAQPAPAQPASAQPTPTQPAPAQPAPAPSSPTTRPPSPPPTR